MNGKWGIIGFSDRETIATAQKRNEDLKKTADRFWEFPDILPAVFVYGNLQGMGV